MAHDSVFKAAFVRTLWEKQHHAGLLFLETERMNIRRDKFHLYRRC